MIFKKQTYEEMVREFAWDLPTHFNIGVACCDVVADDEPDRVALLQWSPDGYRGETSYGALKNLSNRLANGLQKLGAVRGDRIAIVLPQCVESVVAHLAIYKAGMIAVPLARLFQPDALEFRLNNAGVSILITNADGAGKIAMISEHLPDLKTLIMTDTYGTNVAKLFDLTAKANLLDWTELLDKSDAGFVSVNTTPDTPALIIFTSGTTGQAKGALHGHSVVLGHIPGLQTHHEFMPQPGDIAWTPADWAWAGGLLNILLPCLYLRVPVVFGGLDRFDAQKAFQLMAEMKVRNAFIPPTALRLMKNVGLADGKYQFFLRTIGSGGESLGIETHQWVEQELGIRVNEFYGQTECNLVLSAFGAADIMKPGSIGKPVPGHVVAVIDENGNPRPAGERGQVAIKRPDPVMFLEYWNDPKATKDKFLGEWMLTGDQCVVDSDGYFHFVGRDDDIINVAGYRVGPGEIEDCLASHPAVKLAAAVGKPDPLKGEFVKAFVVLSENFKPSEALVKQIKTHVKQHLAANIYPQEIAFVDEIPLTTTGKVIRRIFREQVRKEAKRN